MLSKSSAEKVKGVIPNCIKVIDTILSQLVDMVSSHEEFALFSGTGRLKNMITLTGKMAVDDHYSRNSHFSSFKGKGT